MERQTQPQPKIFLWLQNWLFWEYVAPLSSQDCALKENMSLFIKMCLHITQFLYICLTWRRMLKTSPGITVMWMQNLAVGGRLSISLSTGKADEGWWGTYPFPATQSFLFFVFLGFIGNILNTRSTNNCKHNRDESMKILRNVSM